jgi:transcriptional regulator with XRE-family HTH domain
MNLIPYAVKHLAETLREARLAQGLSQRELAARAGLGQNRLAPIEAGAVDLRASTLVQIARALDLELVLTPRRVLPVVQSLAGTGEPRLRQESQRSSVRGTPIRVLRHIKRHLADLERSHPANDALAKAATVVQSLIAAAPDLEASTLAPLRRVVHWLAQARTNNQDAPALLAKTAAQLEDLQQMLRANRHLEAAAAPQQGAYSLEDDIS